MAVTGSICTNRLQLHAQAERDPALISRNLAELLRWWEAGRLKPLVAEVFPLAEAGKALTALLSRRYAGKIVLET
jgi:NADPH2:quinone reductase